MNPRLISLVGAIAVMLLVTVSCAGSNTSPLNPASPNLQQAAAAPQADSNRYLWAYYQFTYDPSDNSIEAVPVRVTADHFNVLKFLEQGPCYTCVMVEGVTTTGTGTKLVDLAIIHPFTSKNLTGFDVRGIAMFGGSHTFAVSGLTTSDRSKGEGELVNADGFTTLYNATTIGSGPDGLQGYLKGKYTSAQAPNSTLNGYKRHISPGASNTRNMFYAGSSVVQTYELDMPDIKFIFGYAVDASWVKATNKPVQNPADDFPPEANCPEPWKIEIAETPIGQGLTDQGGQTILDIDVYDYDGKMSHFPPVLECNEIFSGNANAIWKEDLIDFTRYEVTLDNEKLAPEGEYKCLISVEDTANIGSPDYLDLTAYQVLTLNVGVFIPQENLPPVAIAHADNYILAPGQDVHFTDDSTDPDGVADIIKREWDFSFDPVDGFQPGSEEQNPTIQYTNPGDYKVQLRVTDSEYHTDMLDAPLAISVTSGDNQAPTAAAHSDITEALVNEVIHLYDDSTDPDGLADIVQWEWDLSFNAFDGFQPGSFQQNPTVQYPTAGTYEIQLRVTDTQSHTDMLDTPLEITVTGGANLPPVAAAHSDITEAQVLQQIHFFDDSTDPDGLSDIIQWEWDFSFNAFDGFQPGSFEQNPTMQYPESGTFQVQLRVTDSASHSDMLNVPLQVTIASDNYPPIAGADANNKKPMVDTLVSFYDASVDPDGFLDMVYFEWDLDGDGIYEKFGKDTTGIFSTGGDYQVQHRVTDTADNVDTLNTPLVIEVNGPPVASAETDKTDVGLGELITLTNTSVDDDGNGAIKHFYWDMNGNGDYDDPVDVEDVSPVTLSFFDAGVHNIGLKVVDIWNLEDELDVPLQITVTGFDPFCLDLKDQENSAKTLFGTRTFRYFQGDIDELTNTLKYQDPNGPWDFTQVPPSQSAICKWLLPTAVEVETPHSIWPDADFFFKEAAPVSGGTVYAPHRFDFSDALNGNLVLQGQWQASTGAFDYGDVFSITHPICQGWSDEGEGDGTFSGVNFSITWSMECLGTGPAVFIVNGDQVVLNCILLRHHMAFVDTLYGVMSFSLLNYQWIDEDGNEIAFMQADNGLQGTNYSGNTYTGTTICRALTNIS